jgi:uncharacterized protein
MATLSDKVAYLRETGTYLGATAGVDIRETHMSWVFLTDRIVYKLKKPVKYPFLDFSTIEKRRFFCEEELRLNRRLAPEVYRAVIPLCQDASGHLNLSGDGRTVDWLVKMERLPAAKMLDRLIHSSRLNRTDIVGVAEVLGGFYETCLRTPVKDNTYLIHLRQEQAVNRAVLTRDELGMAVIVAEALSTVDEALESLTPEIAERIGDGMIVEGHGDLRPEHICLSEPVQIFDCLEFNRVLRITDPFDEVNYLGLECDVLGADWIRPLLVESLEKRLGNRPSRRLLALYGAFRALLRARLCISRLLEKPVLHRDKWKPLALRYLAAAESECVNLRRPEDRRSTYSREDA